MRCETCQHFHQTSDVDGECRRYAPRPDLSQGQATMWPVTACEEWCGEYEKVDTEARLIRMHEDER